MTLSTCAIAASVVAFTSSTTSPLKASSSARSPLSSGGTALRFHGRFHCDDFQPLEEDRLDLFDSLDRVDSDRLHMLEIGHHRLQGHVEARQVVEHRRALPIGEGRSEEHTSELQSRVDLV